MQKDIQDERLQKQTQAMLWCAVKLRSIAGQSNTLVWPWAVAQPRISAGHDVPD